MSNVVTFFKIIPMIYVTSPSGYTECEPSCCGEPDFYSVFKIQFLSGRREKWDYLFDADSRKEAMDKLRKQHTAKKKTLKVTCTVTLLVDEGEKGVEQAIDALTEFSSSACGRYHSGAEIVKIDYTPLASFARNDEEVPF